MKRKTSRYHGYNFGMVSGRPNIGNPRNKIIHLLKSRLHLSLSFWSRCFRTFGTDISAKLNPYSKILTFCKMRVLNSLNTVYVSLAAAEGWWFKRSLIPTPPPPPKPLTSAVKNKNTLCTVCSTWTFKASFLHTTPEQSYLN